MTFGRGSQPVTDPVPGSFRPGDPAGATGHKIDGFEGEVPYLALEVDGIRHAWTSRADREGRYHALTLQLQEDGRTWEASADQPFPTSEAAEAWARRLAAETEG